MIASSSLVEDVESMIEEPGVTSEELVINNVLSVLYLVSAIIVCKTE